MSTHESYSAFAASLRTNEQLRDPATKGTRDYSAGKRIRGGQTKNVIIPVGVLGRLLRALDDDTSDYAADTLGLELTTACMDVAGWEDLRAGAA